MAVKVCVEVGVSVGSKVGVLVAVGSAVLVAVGGMGDGAGVAVSVGGVALGSASSAWGAGSSAGSWDDIPWGRLQDSKLNRIHNPSNLIQTDLFIDYQFSSRSPLQSV